MSVLRFANRILSPGGRHARLTVMIFHRVLPRPHPLLPGEPDASEFELQMRRVREWFHVMRLEDAVQRLQAGTLPARALSITFDDGYADNHAVALPILRKLGLPATFFIATGYLDGGCMWNDEVIETVRACEGPVLDLRSLDLGCLPTGSLDERMAALGALIAALKYESPARRSELAGRVRRLANVDAVSSPMMTSEEVKSLCAEGMDVGAHTHSHPILSRLDALEAREEIARSKSMLERLTGRAVRLFAYPNGKPDIDYNGVHIGQVRELGFIGACSTAPGCAVADTDPLQLPRFTPWDRDWKYGVRLSRNLCNPVRAIS